MTAADPIETLAVGYAPREARAGLAALLALDRTLGQVLRTTREPMVGQLRLAWWREALVRLDSAPPPGEPVLLALATDVLPRGVSGDAMAAMVDGWEPLFTTIDDAAMLAHGRQRGATMFGLAAQLVGQSESWLAEAGQGWALGDLATNLGDQAASARARMLAIPLLEAAGRRRWSRPLRPLGALLHIVRRRLAGSMTPGTVVRLGWHRLTGR